jgi:predicted TIM-barrel fold metal-dependent hydrolase
MRGIRLHPNYHGYDLRDPDFEELLRRAAERGLFVQLVAAMEDVRTQHPLLRVAPVDLSPLAEVAARLPSLRLMLLNWWPALRSKPLEPLAAAGSVYFDIAMFEGIEGIARLAARLPGGRIVFGSNFPLFPVEAAFLKMQESGLPEPARNQILGGNAGRLLSGGS